MLFAKSQDIANKLSLILAGYPQLSGFYYELPQSLGGMEDAKQDIIKLTTISGIIIGVVANKNKLICGPVRIIDWKGQAKKDLILRRVNKRLARRGYSLKTKASHEFDAVGIGLFVVGDF